MYRWVPTMLWKEVYETQEDLDTLQNNKTKLLKSRMTSEILGALLKSWKDLPGFPNTIIPDTLENKAIRMRSSLCWS